MADASLNWFDTDRNGLAKLLERRGKAFDVMHLFNPKTGNIDRFVLTNGEWVLS